MKIKDSGKKVISKAFVERKKISPIESMGRK